MAEIIISIVSKLVECLVNPTASEARYLFCVDKITRDLETQKKELLITKESVLKRVEEAHSKTHEIEDAVKKWLDKVEDLVRAVEKPQQELMGNGGCFRQWCPTPKRYHLCKQLARRSMAMIELHKTSEFNPFSRPAPIPDIEYFSSGNFMLFESTNLVFDEILEALRDDNCYMIGLYGMGGLGKTTLVRELGKKAKEAKLFNHVAFTTVSRTPNVRRIQDEIADLLGMKLEEESEAGRARRIALKLRSKERILVILDDVWTMLKLEDIGIPCHGNDNNCKVLLTTRRQQICNSMPCQRKIPLGLLSEDEAWILFQHHANVDDATHVVARQISKECKRLPIAIVTMGRCLRGKGIDEMNVTLYKLRHSEPIDVDEGEEDVFSCLRLSYDYLRNKEVKLLFLMCAMFPEDYDISREDLFRYGIGLGLCREMDSLEIARSQVNVLINSLIDSSLLTNSKDKDDHFKMHDMIRDVALWIASKEDHTIMINHEKELSTLADEGAIKDCYALCRWHEVKYQFPHQLDASKLEIMLLNISNNLNFSHVSFEGIKGLKVMALMRNDWRRRNILTMPQSTQWLANLQTLRLVGLKLNDISFVASLRRLKILDLHHSTFKELPDRVKELGKLKLLDLSDCDIKEPCRVIERCSELQELYALSNYENTEVPWECLNSDTFPKLERYHVKFGPFAGPRYNPFEVLSSKCLYLGGFNVSTLGAAVKDLLQRADQVCFHNIQGVCKNIFPEMNEAVGGMKALSDLMLANCKKIECLVGTTASQVRSSGGLLMLTPVSPKSCYLKRLEITGCPKLMSLFPMSVAQTLVQLQELEISNCKELRHIMNEEEIQFQTDNSCLNEEEIQFQTDNSCLMFQQFKKLKVYNCDKLECIFPISCSHGFSQLQEIEIRGVTGLKYVFGVSNSAFSRGCNFSSLERLWINGCPLLTSLFPTSVAQTLLQLKWVEIERCNELKHIVVNERGDSLEFPRLEELNLKLCPKLQYLFPVSCIESLVNLKEIVIYEVSGLEYIFGPDDSENRFTNGNEFQIVFPLLEKIYLSDAPNLHQILPKNFRSRFPEWRFSLMNCPKLTTVDFNTVADSEQRQGHSNTSQYAKKVEIINCGVENIFHVQRIGHDEDQQQLISLNLENLRELKFIWTAPKQIFSLKFLKRLKVKLCAKLKCVFNSAVHMSMPLLAELLISECEELEEIFKGNENSPNPPLGLPKLEVLVVKQCNKLKTIFSTSMAMTLSQLEILHITEAAQLEEVVRYEGEDIKDDQKQIMLPQLKKIELKKLPCLVEVWHGLNVHELKLDKIIIDECPILSGVYPRLVKKLVFYQSTRELRLGSSQQ